MGLGDCIDNAVDGGEMDPQRGADLRDLYEGLEAEYRGRMPGDQAAQQAAADAVEATRNAMLEKRRQQLLQLRATQRIEMDLQSYGTGDPREMGKAAIALLDPDDRAPYSNITMRSNAIRGRAHARMVDVLRTFRRHLGGFQRNKAMMDDVVRQAFGQETKSATAKELADAWGEAAEFLRLKFNAAGGRIPKRQDWGLPQLHDSLKVRQVSFAAWREFIAPRLDMTKMVDEVTGLPFTRERLDQALDAVYRTISTDGWANVTPSGNGGRGMLANRHTDHRFLVFKDADAWLQYNKRFGRSDPYSTMVAHVDRMAGDIAMMEVLGPNPSATHQWLVQKIKKNAAELDAKEGKNKNTDRANAQGVIIGDMMAHHTGSANAPVNGPVARTFAGIRHLLMAAQLGSAAISAVTDVNFQRMARTMAGIPKGGRGSAPVQWGRIFGDVVKTMASSKDQVAAARAGLIAENWTAMAIGQARFVDETIAVPEVAQRISDAVMQVSLLSPWTQAGRWAFGQEFMGFLADNAAKPFSELPTPLQTTLRRYAIGEQAWDTLRRTPLHSERGVPFLRPDDVAARTDLNAGQAEQLATRVLEMIQTETEYAVPSASLRGRVFLGGAIRPGSIAGELIKSALMYKNFATTVMFTHFRRTLGQSNKKNRAVYLADLLISTSIVGALAIQAKDMAKGKDPRPMTDGQFWMAAMLQGGGLGIFGDFLFADQNRVGGGPFETVTGPVFAAAADTARLTIGNVQQFAADENTNAGRDAVRFAKRYMPGGSLWYARLALERVVWDRLQDWVDPKAAQARRRILRNAERDFGQGYWWAPGDAVPERAPDLQNTLESRR